MFRVCSCEILVIMQFSVTHKFCMQNVFMHLGNPPKVIMTNNQQFSQRFLSSGLTCNNLALPNKQFLGLSLNRLSWPASQPARPQI